MATTTTIPLITLQVGSRTFGPANAADAEVSITLTIDRTVTGGLNSLDGTAGVAVDVQQSNDGGTNWTDIGGWTAVGGIITNTDRQGVVHTYTESVGFWQLFPGTSRKVRATVTISGTAIAVAGSIVTQ